LGTFYRLRLRQEDYIKILGEVSTEVKPFFRHRAVKAGHGARFVRIPFLPHYWVKRSSVNPAAPHRGNHKSKRHRMSKFG